MYLNPYHLRVDYFALHMIHVHSIRRVKNGYIYHCYTQLVK